MSKPFSHNGGDRVSFSDLGTLLLFLLAVLIIGSTGYVVLEGWSFFDALYMTVITLAAVGYQEIHPLSNPGRVFTIGVIFLGFGVITIFFTTLAQLVVQKQITWELLGKKSRDMIDNLENHTIVCGFGRLARIAAAELRNHSVNLVIIDSDPTRVQEAREEGFLVVEGDATADETLEEAGIRKASRLVSLLPKGSDNLYVVLTSRELSRDLFIMSRAENEVFEKRLRRAGVTRLISPYRVGGQRIADGLIRPYVTNFLDFASSSNEATLQIEEVLIPHDSVMVGQTLQEANFRKQCNVIVAAVIPASKKMVFNPDGKTVIEGGVTFIVLGDKDELHKFEDIIFKTS